MAQRDSKKVQLDFPQLTADIIAALRLTGTLGLFDMSDVVVPTISVGNVRPQTFSFEPVVFGSSEITFGEQANSAIDTILADTGPLAAGTYNIMAALSLSGSVAGVNSPLVLQHRNSANTATLATLLSLTITTTANYHNSFLPLIGYVIGLNERLRVKTANILLAGTNSATIFATLRPTP